MDPEPYFEPSEHFGGQQRPLLRIFPRFDEIYPDRLRLPLEFDAARLQADLARLDAVEWTRHFVPQNYDGEWSVLPLRTPAGATHPLQRILSPPDATWEDTELLAACPAFGDVLARLECPLTAVRLMRLARGSRIKTHRDSDLAAEFGTARLHVPITTNAGVDFRLNDIRVDMAPGSLWYLRLSDPHRVDNDGETDRVHLVIDALVDPWLEARLREAMALAA